MKNQSTIRLMTVSAFQIIKMAPKHFSLSNFHQILKSLESALQKKKQLFRSIIPSLIKST